MRKFLLLLVFLASFFLISIIFPSSSFASWQKFDGNPIIPLGTNGEFDSVRNGAPSIIKKDSNYYMWYEGHNGSLWRIGMATSTDGKSWTKNGPIIIDNSSDVGRPNLHDPSVIYDNGMYKMWYVSSTPSVNEMHINYTTSEDGIHWSTPVISVLSSSLPWDSNKGVSTPSVLHINNKYQLWYAGNGNGDVWVLGYAESDDGQNWVKNSSPVLLNGHSISDSSPSVIYRNNVYEMWYTGPISIYHVYSLNGIEWYDDSDNPALSPGVGFDNRRVGGQFVINDSGLDKMWYTGVNSSDIWQIGYAEKATELPPITPPPPPEPNKVVFIPGLGASWNQGDLFSCDINQSGQWTLAPYVDEYNTLIKTFTDNAGLKLNENFYVYGYDWRQSMDHAGQKLKDFIDTIQPNGKVDIISHSLGGLVARSYITQNSDHKVDKLVTIGTPHQGALLAYPLWENGEVWTDNFVDKVGINTLINYCRTKVGKPIGTKRQAVHAVSPSIRDILPTFDFLRMNNQIVISDLIEGENPWLKNNSFDPSVQHVNLLTIGGNDKKTFNIFDIKNASKADKLLGNYIDGAIKKKNTTQEGDGTVLLSSALVNGGDDATFDLNHIGLVKNKKSLEKVLNFLGYSSVEAMSEQKVAALSSASSFSVSVDKPAVITLETFKGEKIDSNEDGISTIYTDKKDKFKLTISPKESGKYTINYSQMGASDVWKEYTFDLKEGKPKSFILNYNPKKPVVLPLIAI